MNIIEYISFERATNHKHTDEAAFWYWNSGITPLPCRGKQPNLPEWKQFQQRRPTRQEITVWIKSGAFQTVAVLCGAVSRNLIVMDLDSEAAVSAFELKFPNLMDTFTVKSGSGKGMHLYYQVERLPQTARVALEGEHHGIELRSNGLYVIAPPSLHPVSGMPYVVAKNEPIKILPHMEHVREWIHGLIRTKYRSPDAPPPPNPLPPLRPGKWTPRDEYMRLAYLRSAKQQQIARVTGATMGTRNDALYMSAQCLGQFIGAGELERGEIEALLLNAAITTGLPEIEAQKTIASGITAGMAKPRRVPPAPEKKA